MSAEILHGFEQQARVISKETKPRIAATTETASLAIGFMAVIEGKGLSAPQLRFVFLKLSAYVAARSVAFRPSNDCPFLRCGQPIPAAISIRVRVAVETRGCTCFVPPSATASTLQNGVRAMRKLDQLAIAPRATRINLIHEVAHFPRPIIITKMHAVGRAFNCDA